MKFLLLTHIFPPAIDGGSQIIYKVSRYLRQNNYEIMVVTTDCDSTDDFVKPYTPVAGPDAIRLPVYRTHRRLPKPLFKLIPFWKTFIQIIKFRPDYIIAGPFPTLISFYALIFKIMTKSKLLLIPCFHPTDESFFGLSLTLPLKQADLIWTFTEFEKKYLTDHFHLNPEKVFYQILGVDDNFVTKAPAYHDTKELLFVGNFAAHKGVRLLIEAVNQIPDCTLTLIGKKTLYYPEIEPLLTPKIRVIFDDPKLRPYTPFFDHSAALVLPSSQESFGLVLVEAMARGKPIIVSDIPELSELISKSHAGLTFKTNDISDLIDKIKTILGDRELAKKLGENGLDFVSKYATWNKVMTAVMPNHILRPPTPAAGR